MTECNKNITVADIPECDSVSPDSYLIVQSPDAACKVKISDLVLGPENVDFYPDLQDILARLNELESVVQTNSANWNNTYQTVTDNKPTWDTVGDYNLSDLATKVNDNADAWTSAANTVEQLSGSWNYAFDSMSLNVDLWNYTASAVELNSANWDLAFIRTLNGMQFVNEAIKTIEDSPWFSMYYIETAAGMPTTISSQPPLASLWSVFTTVNNLSSTW